MDGIGNALVIGVAMTFHHDTVQAQKHRTIMVVGVQMMLEQMHGGLGNQEADLGPDGAGKGGAQQIGDETGRALRRLQRHIAGKTVADDDIGLATSDLVAFGKAIERQGQARRRAQDRGGVTDFFRALHVFRADVHDANARAFKIESDARISRAHHRELHQVAGVALGIGAQVQHDHVIVAERRQQSRQSGPINAGHGTQRQLGHRHQRAGITGRNRSARLASLHRRDRHAHGAGFLADGGAGFIPRRHDIAGVHHFGRGPQIRMIVEGGLDPRLVSEKGEA